MFTRNLNFRLGTLVPALQKVEERGETSKKYFKAAEIRDTNM